VSNWTAEVIGVNMKINKLNQSLCYDVREEVQKQNALAIMEMKKRFNNYLTKDSNMSLSEVFEFARALAEFREHVIIGDEEHNSACCHLVSIIDTQEDGIGEQPRYKLILKYEWAMKNCIRDWKNRYEMGR